MKKITQLAAIALLIASCGSQKQLVKQADKLFINDEFLKHAHVGVSVYQTSTNKFIYQHQADQFFVPASNTKILSTYAAMKYLGDSIPGIKYVENDTAVFILPTGDPTLLHEDYKVHPVFEFLKNTSKKIYITSDNWKSTAFGNAWSWDYYSFYYGPERSPMPIYGNYINFAQSESALGKSYQTSPKISWQIVVKENDDANFYANREWRANKYTVTVGKNTGRTQQVPFMTDGLNATITLLQEALGKEIFTKSLNEFPSKDFKVIYSQPVDSMLKPLMYRSDNFFAEQTMLMVSNELLGVMDEDRIAAELRKTLFKSLPNNYRWADGSGLSRVNHISPNDFIAILKLMKEDIGMDRIKGVFANGGVGTLASLYGEIKDKIYAKTGSLTGVTALSGYLETKSGDHLIFSLQVNNNRGDAAKTRQNFKDFLLYLYNNY